MVLSGSCQESTPSTQERGKKMRRKRFQKGSLQKRKHGKKSVWVAFWWEDGSRRSSVLGTCSKMTQSEAESALADILRPINSGVSTGPRPVYTFEKFVTEQAFENPKFVEDIIRDLAMALDKEDRVTWYHIESENFESIHNHNAYAMIERDKRE